MIRMACPLSFGDIAGALAHPGRIAATPLRWRTRYPQRGRKAAGLSGGIHSPVAAAERMSVDDPRTTRVGQTRSKVSRQSPSGGRRG